MLEKQMIPSADTGILLITRTTGPQLPPFFAVTWQCAPAHELLLTDQAAFERSNSELTVLTAQCSCPFPHYQRTTGSVGNAERETAENPSAASSADFENKEVISCSVSTAVKN